MKNCLLPSKIIEQEEEIDSYLLLYAITTNEIFMLVYCLFCWRAYELAKSMSLHILS